MPPISVPTASPLPPSQRVQSTSPPVFRILNRLSRSSLISLVLDWLDDRNQALSAPYLAEDPENEDPNDLYPPAKSLEELREYYEELQGWKGVKRDVVDRIIEGDWRNGVSLYQLAMADMQHLYDHPTSQKFTALKVVQLRSGKEDQENVLQNGDLPCLPRFHPPTFLQNLKRQVLPDVKVHYNLDRPRNLPLLLLRIYILDSPYNTSLAISNSNATFLDSSKTIYVAFPDASPHIYVSLTTSISTAASQVNNASETRSLRKHLLDGLPKAFSRPRARYGLEPTGLAARTLEALLSMRGQGRTNSAGGGWGIYASEKRKDTPLNTQLPTPSAEESDDELANPPAETSVSSKGFKRKTRRDEDQALAKRRRLVAQSRFGDSAKPGDGKGIEQLHIRFEVPFPPITPSGESAPAANEDLTDWVPDIRAVFQGNHIFAGLRELVRWGVVDGERMPGWMTGEEGVSVGAVADGRIRGFKGSGI